MTRPAVSPARRRRILAENLLAYAFLLPAMVILLIFHFAGGFAAIGMSLFKWEIGRASCRERVYSSV